LSAARFDEDPGVRLLTDIRTIFRARDIDRITSAVLLEALIGPFPPIFSGAFPAYLNCRRNPAAPAANPAA
jgi:hypothetical protein